MEMQLAAGQAFDDEHGAGADGTAQAWRLRRIDAGWHAKKSAATFERSAPSAVGEESAVPDANQATRQNMQQEAAQELSGGNGHDPLFAAVGIVPPTKRDAIVFKGNETMFGDGHTVCVPGQVVENMFGSAEGRLGVDDPVLLAESPEEVAEWAGWGKRFEWGVELQSVLLELFPELLAEFAAEHSAKHLDRQKETARGIDPSGAIEGQAAGRDDVVDMGMMLKVLFPGMEHAEKPDVGSRRFGSRASSSIVAALLR
jgi:hypothetical protein